MEIKNFNTIMDYISLVWSEKNSGKIGSILSTDVSLKIVKEDSSEKICSKKDVVEYLMKINKKTKVSKISIEETRGTIIVKYIAEVGDTKERGSDFITFKNSKIHNIRSVLVNIQN